LWNEDANHWFALTATANAVGGSVSWDSNTSTATASIYGVTVHFKHGNDGIEIRHGKMHVRADVFYNTIMAEAKHLVFIGTHPVGDAHNLVDHASIITMVYEGHEMLRLPFSEHFMATNSLYGEKIRYATIGAGPNHGMLIGAFNRIDDRDLEMKTGMRNIDVNAETLIHLFYRANHYNVHRRDIPYKMTGFGRGNYNSNSYARGVLRAVGIRDSNNLLLPGWGNPVPMHEFYR
jgi:hypothetical protein